ncbi:DUF4411 family protein [Brachybacterium paraconglomeratum]|uniref:DUF4411 family protein n=1 Tax=Brachybacterium paraconglomeratum TaxID=173362 RepID=UPI002492F254|nr:DUF4411 family protein [Brachybacterium paraconglomeratum]
MHLVDANVLIEAKNRYYAFDIAPGFWAWLEQGHRTGKLISIDAVRDELVQGDDELAEWARGRRDFFLPIDQLTVQRFRPLSDWARHQNYRQSALNEFSSDRGLPPDRTRDRARRHGDHQRAAQPAGAEASEDPRRLRRHGSGDR